MSVTDGESTPDIAVLMPDLAGAGAQRVLLNLAIGIAKRGYRVDVVLAQAYGAYLSELPPELNVVDLNASRLLTSLPLFYRYLSNRRPMAVLSGPSTMNLIALWGRRVARANCRIIATQHCTLSIDTHFGKNIRHRQLTRLARAFYPWADAVIAVSNGVASDLTCVANLKPEQVQVIYNPVITSDVRLKSTHPTGHPWFDEREPPVILAVGRLTRQKNFPLLINAFSIVRKQQDARLMILGDGDERASLDRLISQLGLQHDVCMPGFVDNPYSYMSSSDVFALSSDWEGLPTVLIEALYCGARLVSTDCPSGPYEILNGGKYGTLVPVNDIGGMAQALLSALAQSGQPIVDSTAWRRFELENVVDQYINMLLP